MKKILKVTKEELESVRINQKCSGMFLPGGTPMGNPREIVFRLCRKYKIPDGYGLNPNTGTFQNRQGQEFEFEEEP